MMKGKLENKAAKPTENKAGKAKGTKAKTPEPKKE